MTGYKPFSVGVFAALVLFSAIALAADVQDVVGEVSQSGYTDFLANRLYTHLGDNRGIGGAQHDLARSNIYDTFAGLGLNPVLDPFTYDGSTYNNVVATLPGTVHPSEIYIIGAHYDSVNNPGADDNASGVAGVLEAAAVLARHRFDATIVFIAFDREEQGLIGSKAYANAHTADDIRGMVSLDMIAYNPSGAHHDKAYVYGRTASNPIKSDLAAAIAAYGNGISAVIGGDTPYSDHAPFEANGDQACLLIEHAVWDNPYYHKAADSVDTAGYIDYAYGTKMTRSVVGWLATEADLIPAVHGTWKAAGSGVWSNPGNWDGGVPCYAGDVAVFGLQTAPAEVTLDSAVTLSALTLNNVQGCSLVPAAPNDKVTLSNSDAPVPLTVSAGAHGIAADVVMDDDVSIGTAMGAALSISGDLSEIDSGASLTKTGAGDLILSGMNTYSGATNVQEGALILDGGDLADDSAVNVALDATLEVASGQPGLGIITGQGSTVVSGEGTGLTARSITQGTLFIGSNANRGMSIPVPEPSSLLLLVLAILSAACIPISSRSA